jgi:hypothetical protein
MLLGESTSEQADFNLGSNKYLNVSPTKLATIKNAKPAKKLTPRKKNLTASE